MLIHKQCRAAALYVTRPMRIRRLHGFSIAAVLAIALASSGIATGSIASAAAATQLVPGTFGLNGIACQKVGTCEAVGVSSSLQSGVVVTVSGGSPGSPVPVTAAQQLTGIACPSAALCEAVGFNSQEGVVTQIVNGVPGGTQVVPGTEVLTAIACTSVTACVAVGYSRDSTTDEADGLVVPVDNGVPGNAEPVPGVNPLDGIACPSQTTCYAVGNTETAVGAPTSQAGILLPIANGVPQTATEVPATQALIGVACPKKKVCFATGVSQPTNSGPEGAIVRIGNGKPKKTAVIIPQAQQLNDAACATSKLCVAAGNTSSSAEGIIVPLVKGKPSTPQDIDGTYSFNGISCPSSSACEAVGVSTGGDPYEGVVATISINGT